MLCRLLLSLLSELVETRSSLYQGGRVSSTATPAKTHTHTGAVNQWRFCNHRTDPMTDMEDLEQALLHLEERGGEKK